MFTLALGFVSCSNDETETTDNILAENIQKFGTRSSEVNLYFGSNKIASTHQTRSCDVNANMWGDIIPDYPTQDEVNGVLAHVQNGGQEVEWPGYTYYFVQHVTGAHHKYSYTDRNNYTHSDIDGTAHLDYFKIEENRELKSWEIDPNTGKPYSWVDLYTHVQDFNNGQCSNATTHNASLMTEGFKSAKSHDSYGDTDIKNWKLFYWNGNYYLGFDYEMKKDDGSIAPDGIYDDWIVKIIPGKGETPVVPSPSVDPTPTPDPTPVPDTPATKKKGEVEFDIHEQMHQTWNEIKTSIHVRDTAAVRVFLPIPIESQAVADDFAIRSGNLYDYQESFEAKFTFAEKEFTFPVQINHTSAGIEILIDCTTKEAKEALKMARGVFDDGITFEIHSYVNPDVAPDQIWNWLKAINLPGTKASQWPQDGDICTHVYGQISSAYNMDEMKHFDENPE